MDLYKEYKTKDDINDWEYLNIQEHLMKKRYANNVDDAILQHLHQWKKHIVANWSNNVVYLEYITKRV